jgi:hypothetical protein
LVTVILSPELALENTDNGQFYALGKCDRYQGCISAFLENKGFQRNWFI